MPEPVHILVVDDEEDVAHLFRQRFRRDIRKGKLVMHFAHSGQDALDFLDQEDGKLVVLVLSDINMPGMTGLDLLAHVKQNYPNLHVMMLTAYSDAQKRALAEERGADAYLTKPIDFDELRAEMEAMLREAGGGEGHASAESG
jgi:CheY-like chemotaxis protein